MKIIAEIADEDHPEIKAWDDYNEKLA